VAENGEQEAPLNGHKSLSMSLSVKALTGALIAVQTELPTLTKGKLNPFFKSKYAGLETVLPAALKVLTSHGLALVQTVGGDGQGGTTLTTILLHESGEWISDTQPLLLVKVDPQSQGSAITYGRRYALMAMLGLVAEDDDDGQAASRQVEPRQTAEAPQPRARRAPAQPKPETAALEDGKSTPAQGQAIHRILSVLHGGDEQAQVETMQAVCPKAVVGTQVHTSDLTMREASEVIRELQPRKGPPAPPAPEARSPQ
jgi:hypothetical protein